MIRQSGGRARAQRRGSAIGLLSSCSSDDVDGDGYADDAAYAANVSRYSAPAMAVGSVLGAVKMDRINFPGVGGVGSSVVPGVDIISRTIESTTEFVQDKMEFVQDKLEDIQDKVEDIQSQMKINVAVSTRNLGAVMEGVVGGAVGGAIGGESNFADPTGAGTAFGDANQWASMDDDDDETSVSDAFGSGFNNANFNKEESKADGNDDGFGAAFGSFNNKNGGNDGVQESGGGDSSDAFGFPFDSTSADNTAAFEQFTPSATTAKTSSAAFAQFTIPPADQKAPNGIGSNGGNRRTMLNNPIGSGGAGTGLSKSDHGNKGLLRSSFLTKSNSFRMPKTGGGLNTKTITAPTASFSSSSQPPIQKNSFSAVRRSSSHSAGSFDLASVDEDQDFLEFGGDDIQDATKAMFQMDDAFNTTNEKELNGDGVGDGAADDNNVAVDNRSELEKGLSQSCHSSSRTSSSSSRGGHRRGSSSRSASGRGVRRAKSGSLTSRPRRGEAPTRSKSTTDSSVSAAVSAAAEAMGGGQDTDIGGSSSHRRRSFTSRRSYSMKNSKPTSSDGTSGEGQGESDGKPSSTRGRRFSNDGASEGRGESDAKPSSTRGRRFSNGGGGEDSTKKKSQRSRSKSVGRSSARARSSRKLGNTGETTTRGTNGSGSNDDADNKKDPHSSKDRRRSRSQSVGRRTGRSSRKLVPNTGDKGGSDKTSATTGTTRGRGRQSEEKASSSSSSSKHKIRSRSQSVGRRRSTTTHKSTKNILEALTTGDTPIYTSESDSEVDDELKSPSSPEENGDAPVVSTSTRRRAAPNRSQSFRTRPHSSRRR